MNEKKYYIDFVATARLTANSEEEAKQKFWEHMKQLDFHGVDIDLIEEADENEDY